MARKFKFVPGEHYHIYNRGVDKRKIFMDENDRKRFLFSLYIFNNIAPIRVEELSRKKIDNFEEKRAETLTDIGAYCLMPNHFHLLLREKEEGGISKFIQKLTTAYSKYFNTKYDRTGALLEGTFKAEHAYYDQYLEYLLSYIHLNPIKLIDKDWKEKGIKDKEKAKKYLGNYFYSSYLDYIGKDRVEKKILDKEAFPEYINNKKHFENHLYSWMEFE